MGPRSDKRWRAALGALLCLLALTPIASAATAGQSVTPLTSVKVIQCQRGSTAAERVATFRGGMRQTSGATRLSIRFSLQESVGGARYKSIQAPGLGVWRKSRTGVGAFAYRQKVRALADGSAYRVIVEYRWQNAAGVVLKRTKRRSHSCRQTGPLPNLKVQRIGGKAVEGAPGRTRYAVTVFNNGTAAAPASAIELTVNGIGAGRMTVPPLAIGQISRVFIEGPKCTDAVAAEADPDALIQEANEIDNDRSAACPAS
jgi:CARDB